MSCAQHNWWFDTPCPKCEMDPADPLKIPAFLERREQRLWRDDNMRWVMAPKEVKAGERFEWAGHDCIAVLIDGVMRYREV